MVERGRLGRRFAKSSGRLKLAALSSIAGSVIVATLVALAPAALSAAPNLRTYAPPFKGSVVPTTSLLAYNCAKAVNPIPYRFNFTTGTGGASFAVSAKGCPKNLYRLGDYSRGTANGFAEIFVDFTKVPSGIHNVTASVSVTYGAAVSESNGTATGACPTARMSSTSGSYYNGTGWSYWPSFSGPIKYTGSTYFYYKTSHGAQGSCDAWSFVQEAMQAFIVNHQNTIGYSLTPSYFPLANAYVRTTNSTYWDCSNYTLWSYGTWSNSSSSCTSSNATATTTSYDYLAKTAGTNSSLTFAGTSTFLFTWTNVSLNSSTQWVLGLLPQFGLDCYSQGYPLGHCRSVATMGSTGNGLKLNSISIG